MKSSSNLLLKQYLDAVKIKYNKNDKSCEQEFYKWIKQMQEISKYYINFLEEMNFDFKNSNCAEISKSFFDTIVKPYNTRLITLYENGLNDIGKTRVIKGDLVVYNERPGIEIPFMGRLCFINNVYDTFMTQNPYVSDDLKKLELLHNSGNYKIIAGAFGFIDDKNRAKKICDLKRLRDSLYGEYAFDFDKKDGVYFCAVGTKKKNKKVKI